VLSFYRQRTALDTAEVAEAAERVRNGERKRSARGNGERKGGRSGRSARSGAGTG